MDASSIIPEYVRGRIKWLSKRINFPLVCGWFREHRGSGTFVVEVFSSHSKFTVIHCFSNVLSLNWLTLEHGFHKILSHFDENLAFYTCHYRDNMKPVTKIFIHFVILLLSDGIIAKINYIIFVGNPLEHRRAPPATSTHENTTPAWRRSDELMNHKKRCHCLCCFSYQFAVIFHHCQ